MYVIIWKYRIKAGRREEFEKYYSSNGSWAKLFGRGKGYLGTELVWDENEPDRYFTIDRWDSRESYDAFMSEWMKQYRELDAVCEGLTENEKKVGEFTSV